MCGCYQIIVPSVEDGIDIGNKQYCIQQSGERKGNRNTIPEDKKQLRDLERALDHGVSNVSFDLHNMTTLQERVCQ